MGSRWHHPLETSCRLARLLLRLVPASDGTVGLLALALVTSARSSTRTDAAGRRLLLDEQDRSRWDRDATAEAGDLLAAAARRGPPGRWWLEAAVAVEHARAPSTAATDWDRIAHLLEQLETRTGLPTYRVERALAVAEVAGPAAGLALLDDVDREALAMWPSLPAVEGELLARCGRRAAARAAWERARELVDQPGPRSRIEERLLTLEDPRSEDRS